MIGNETTYPGPEEVESHIWPQEQNIKAVPPNGFKVEQEDEDEEETDEWESEKEETDEENDDDFQGEYK